MTLLLLMRSELLSGRLSTVKPVWSVSQVTVSPLFVSI